MIFSIFLLMILFLLLPAWAVRAEERKPSVHLLATGGTIAGKASSETATTGYEAGALGVEDLLSALPEVKDYAHVTGEEICGIDSKDMTDTIWLTLAERVNELAGKKDGLVIIHGTDTMEETAWFLQLTVNPSIPLVLTGAMRPATALSADGPMNLLNAVRLAGDPSAKGKGALVMMNDTIFAARNVTKGNTLSLDTFRSPDGPLGYMNDGHPCWCALPVRIPKGQAPFDIRHMKSLPKVYIVYGTACADGAMVRGAVFAGAEGIIYAGTGNGSIHKADEIELAKAAAAGIPVVRSSHTGSGSVISAEPSYDREGFIHGGSLSPQKARILLQLALTRTKNFGEIGEMFERY